MGFHEQGGATSWRDANSERIFFFSRFQAATLSFRLFSSSRSVSRLDSACISFSLRAFTLDAIAAFVSASFCARSLRRTSESFGSPNGSEFIILPIPKGSSPRRLGALLLEVALGGLGGADAGGDAPVMKKSSIELALCACDCGIVVARGRGCAMVSGASAGGAESAVSSSIAPMPMPMISMSAAMLEVCETESGAAVKPLSRSSVLPPLCSGGGVGVAPKPPSRSSVSTRLAWLARPEAVSLLMPNGSKSSDPSSSGGGDGAGGGCEGRFTGAEAGERAAALGGDVLVCAGGASEGGGSAAKAGGRRGAGSARGCFLISLWTWL
mmetsp:Transcript_20082/g.48145  ORF Transcript_20082/g.48145 Transcript_20082/m.48145 type:complete len:325 (-) Transcript_20082:888-1862(-)